MVTKADLKDPYFNPLLHNVKIIRPDGETHTRVAPIKLNSLPGLIKKVLKL